MIQMKLFTKQNHTRPTDLENKLMITKGERWGGGGENGDCNIHTTIFKIDNQQGLIV